MATDSRITPVANASDKLLFFPVIPGVAYNAAHRRHGARHEEAVAHSGDSGNLRVESIREVGAFREQLMKAAVVIGAKTRQIVVAELIDNDGDNEFRPGRRGGEGRPCEQKQ